MARSVVEAKGPVSTSLVRGRKLTIIEHVEQLTVANALCCSTKYNRLVASTLFAIATIEAQCVMALAACFPVREYGPRNPPALTTSHLDSYLPRQQQSPPSVESVALCNKVSNRIQHVCSRPLLEPALSRRHFYNSV